MAAHVYTALKEIKNNPEGQMKHLGPALRMAPWCDQLEWEDYTALVAIESNSDLIGLVSWLETALPRYEGRWMNLGQPEDLYEWNACWRLDG